MQNSIIFLDCTKSAESVQMSSVRLSDVFKRMVIQKATQLDPPSRTGRPKELSDDDAVHLMFKVCRTGMQWRELECNVSYTTVMRRMHRWTDKNVFVEAYRRALQVYRKHNATTHCCVDSTFVKNVFGRDCIGRNPTDRGRKAIKLSAVTDQNGVVFGIHASPANIPDVSLLQQSLSSMLLNVDSLPLFADRGYDSRRNRNICNDFGLLDRIFRKRTRTTRRSNAKRVVVEHTFSWMDKYRRLLMMFEQRSVVHQSFAFLALGSMLVARFDVPLEDG